MEYKRPAHRAQNGKGGTTTKPDTNTESVFPPLLDPAAFGRRAGFEDLTGLHGEWMREMLTAKGDMTLQAHRGSFKTTCLCIVIALLCVTRGNENIIFLRKTDGGVHEVIRQTANILKSDAMKEETRAFYGREVTLKASAGEITTCFYTAKKGCAQLTGIGIGGSLTGRHADWVFTDDIVNLKDRQSAAERDRTARAYQELQNIKNRGGRIINTGTPWHREDCFRLMPRPLRYDCYTTGLITKEQLEKLKGSMTPSLFAANYELKHIADADALFDTEPQFSSDAGVLAGGIAHVDAAYGGGDSTAFTCASRAGDKVYLYGKLWHAHVQQVIPEIVRISQTLGCSPVYCETNADKGYLGRELRKEGLECRMYAERRGKYTKIASLLKKEWSSTVFIEGTDREYIEQIRSYSAGAAHDDAPDSAASAIGFLPE